MLCLDQIEEFIPEHIVHTRKIGGFVPRQTTEFLGECTGKALTFFDNPDNFQTDILHIERLVNIFVSTFCNSVNPLVVIRKSRKQHDRNMTGRYVRFYVAAQLESVERRHQHVAQDKRYFIIHHGFNGIVTVIDGNNAEVR